MDLHGILLLPPQASQEAAGVDRLFYGLVAASALVAGLVFFLLVLFAWRYRAGRAVPRKPLPKMFEHEIEITWTLGTLFAFFAIFWWASTLDFIHIGPPKDTLNIRVVGKQWMWKIEQPNGVREIDELHVPIDTPIQLLLTSQDVIHSFYVPAFRVKQDLLPDQLTQLWFTPDKLGTYPLRCAEFCGVYHSQMDGDVVVMSKADYARWAEHMKNGSLQQRGATEFLTQGCSSCHTGRDTAKGPTLVGLYGRRVRLKSGRTTNADDDYIRTAILDPGDTVVEGYGDTMPSYSGKLDAAQITALAAYIKSLSPAQEPSP